MKHHRLPRAAALLLAMLAAGPSFGDPAHDAAHERARLEREQAEAEATFNARQATCQQQFVVTPCVDAARAERRRTLERIRSERAVIDDAERRRRASERVAEIERRERELAQKAAGAASAPPRDARESAPARPARPLPPPKPPADRRVLETEAAERAAAREKRASEAAAHRAKVESRNANGKPPSPSLPTPSSVPP